MPSELLSFKPLVDRYLKVTSSSLSVFSFANIFIWQDFFRFQFDEIDDNLCIFASDQAGTFLYVSPLGKMISRRAVQECFDRMQKLNKAKSVTRIENVSEEQLKYFPDTDYKIYRKSYDYMYFRRDLVQLKGDAYKSKRNAYNHFAKNYPATYRPYEPSLAKQCMDLYEDWAKAKRLTLKDDVDLFMLEDSKIVHRRVLESFAALDLIGRVVEVDGKVVAYTFGYFLNEKTFCDLLEIADKKYSGLATYVFYQFCNDSVLANVKFINVMDDFAIKSVNRVKMSFRPSLKLPAYVVSRL
ncbi:MAG: DUF2156 domain-containing protein [Candidatus Omnitrophica bacterium]|nr:DUF2156 domain-containing protein [Candidatus Omnitrophota bacterium]